MKFKGTTEQCFRHFSKANHLAESTRDIMKNRKTICKLIGIAEGTGFHWFVQGRIPGGNNLLKLRLLLTLCGYELTEWVGVASAIIECGDQIALGVLKISDVASFLEVTEDTVMRIVVNLAGTLENRVVQMEELIQYHHDDGNEKKAEWTRVIQTTGIKEPESTTTSVALEPFEASPQKRVKAVMNGDGSTVPTLAHLIQASIPLAKRLLSDDFSPDDRRQLRELTAQASTNGVFELSNLLNRLCGERARKEIQSH